MLLGWDAAVLAFLAGLEPGTERDGLVALAVVTVMGSWVVLNSVFTLRYAEDDSRDAGTAPAAGPPPGAAPVVPVVPVDFGGAPADDLPDYRDFAYLAFTIGMTYQVSDTNLRDRRVRRTVLFHAVLSYVFGVVIVAAGVNVVASQVG